MGLYGTVALKQYTATKPQLHIYPTGGQADKTIHTSRDKEAMDNVQWIGNNVTYQVQEDVGRTFSVIMIKVFHVVNILKVVLAHQVRHAYPT